MAIPSLCSDPQALPRGCGLTGHSLRGRHLSRIFPILCSRLPRATCPGGVHTTCALAPVCNLIATSYSNCRENNVPREQHCRSHARSEVCFLHNFTVSTCVSTCVSTAIPNTRCPGDASGSADTQHRVLGVVTLRGCSYHHSRQKSGTSSTSQRHDVLSSQRQWLTDMISGL